MSNNKAIRSALGGNPLKQGIFSKTETQNTVESPESDSDSTIILAPATEDKKSRFANKKDRDGISLRIPIELNEWIDDTIKKGKRKHGAKIPKEVWIQAALELFKAAPIDWTEVDSEESLHLTLLDLESRIKNI